MNNNQPSSAKELPSRPSEACKESSGKAGNEPDEASLMEKLQYAILEIGKKSVKNVNKPTAASSASTNCDECKEHGSTEVHFRVRLDVEKPILEDDLDLNPLNDIDTDNSMGSNDAKFQTSQESCFSLNGKTGSNFDAFTIKKHDLLHQGRNTSPTFDLHTQAFPLIKIIFGPAPHYSRRKFPEACEGCLEKPSPDTDNISPMLSDPRLNNIKYAAVLQDRCLKCFASMDNEKASGKPSSINQPSNVTKERNFAIRDPRRKSETARRMSELSSTRDKIVEKVTREKVLPVEETKIVNKNKEQKTPCTKSTINLTDINVNLRRSSFEKSNTGSLLITPENSAIHPSAETRSKLVKDSSPLSIVHVKATSEKATDQVKTDSNKSSVTLEKSTAIQNIKIINNNHTTISSSEKHNVPEKNKTRHSILKNASDISMTTVSSNLFTLFEKKSLPSCSKQNDPVSVKHTKATSKHTPISVNMSKEMKSSSENVVKTVMQMTSLVENHETGREFVFTDSGSAPCHRSLVSASETEALAETKDSSTHSMTTEVNNVDNQQKVTNTEKNSESVQFGATAVDESSSMFEHVQMDETPLGYLCNSPPNQGKRKAESEPSSGGQVNNEDPPGSNNSVDWGNPEWANVELPTLNVKFKKRRKLNPKKEKSASHAKDNKNKSSEKDEFLASILRTCEEESPRSKSFTNTQAFEENKVKIDVKNKENQNDLNEDMELNLEQPLQENSPLNETVETVTSSCLSMETDQSPSSPILPDILPTAQDTNVNTDSGIFTSKGETFYWPFSYPSLDQLKEMPDSDDEIDSTRSYNEVVVVVERLEEEGYLPKCFVSAYNSEHTCCKCCPLFCCASPWVNINDFSIIAA
ncbi:unnamed protein product [Clavelina lepadiformis]|uniref:Uncharacterized protein n=1 Tax=Clavelina lepadiformis TaxID=159417 RepID=A0ABP0H468_CLALP